MGKTTTIFALMGLLPPEDGTATFDGLSLIGLPPFRIAQAGLGLVPEGRQIFPTLTVEENLVATGATRFGAKQWTLDRVYDFFPALKERRNHMGNELSGGEQQMLAIGRALMTNPKLLILDEATEGLAPKIRTEIWQCLKRLKQEGQAILIVDKHLEALLRFADRHAGRNIVHCHQPDRGFPVSRRRCRPSSGRTQQRLGGDQFFADPDSAFYPDGRSSFSYRACTEGH